MLQFFKSVVALYSACNKVVEKIALIYNSRDPNNTDGLKKSGGRSESSVKRNKQGSE